MNNLFILCFITIGLFFSSCSQKSQYNYSKPQSYSSSKSNYARSLNSKEYKSAKMNPYIVRGIKYYPLEVSVGENFFGNASWYGPDFHGKLTANGEQYNMYDNTAAHKTFPMNTIVKVTNQNNGLSTIVRINDRGPFIQTRIIDLSNTAAKKINMIGTGTAPVTLEILGYYSKNKTQIISKKEKKKPTKYALQIASFSNIDRAMLMQEKFDGIDGYQTIIKDIQKDNIRVFKVYLKGFKTQKEIRNYKANSNFPNAFIVKQ